MWRWRAGAWVISAILLSGAVGPSRMPPSAVAAGWGWWDLASSEGYGTTPTDAWGWLLVAAPHTGTPLDLIGTTGSAMAVLGLCLLLDPRSPGCARSAVRWRPQGR